MSQESFQNQPNMDAPSGLAPSARFAHWITAHPFRSLGLGLLLVFSLATGLSRLKPNFTHTAFFEKTNPMMQTFDAFERRFGNDDALLVIVHSPSGIFDEESVALLGRLTNDLWKVPEVIRVDSLSNFQWVHADGDDIAVEDLLPGDRADDAAFVAARREVALGHEIVPDYLVSRDGKTAVLHARIAPGIDKAPNAPLIVKQAQNVLARHQQGDHRFYISGGPAVNFAFEDSSARDMATLIPIVIGLVVLLLAATLRGGKGVVLPLVVVGLSTVAAFGASGWLGLEVTVVTSVLPQVLIAVGIADSVHILASFYHRRREGMDKRQAAREALTKNFAPTLMTSVTTAVGFFSFLTAELKPVSGLGVLAGLGTMLAWLITYLLMGPLMVLLPSRQRAQAGAHQPLPPSRLIRGYVNFLDRARWPVVMGVAAVMLTAAVLSLGNRVNSDPYQYFSPGYPLRDASDFMREHLGYQQAFELVVESGAEDGVKDPAFLHKVQQLKRQILEIPGMVRTISIVDILRQTNRALNGDAADAYVLPADRETVAQELFLYTMGLPQGQDLNDRITVNNDAIRLSVLSGITDSETWMNAAADMVAKAKALGLDAHVTGKGLLYQGMNRFVVESFITSLLLAVFAVGVLLAVFLRSVRLGLVAMLPNLVPLIIGGAVLRMLGHSLDLGTVLVCSVCLGIAVDDTIHIMSNFRRLTAGGAKPVEALAQVFSETGRALVVTTVVLVVGFGTLAFGTFSPNVYFGIMTAVILSSALLIDLTFLPALLLLTEGRAPVAAARASTARLEVGV